MDDHITLEELTALDEKKLSRRKLFKLISHFQICEPCFEKILYYKIFKRVPHQPNQAVTKIENVQALELVKDATRDHTIKILHLSDLHFGPHSRFKDRNPEDVADLVAASLREFWRQTEDDGLVDLVIVTGDLAERAERSEFKQAFQFFKTFADALSLSRRQFIFTPGNHDISWPSCKIAFAQQEIEGFDNDELSRRLSNVKLDLYYKGLKSFLEIEGMSEVATPLTGGGWLYNFPKLKMSVAALNSCEKESHLPKDHCGMLSYSQAHSLMQAWHDNPDLNNWIKIVAIHHNPEVVPTRTLEWWVRQFKKFGIKDRELTEVYFGDIAGFQGRDYLKAINQDARVQLFLHGHQHSHDRIPWPWRAGGGQGYVISAGSLGLEKETLPRDEPLSLGYIRMDRLRRKLKAFRLTLSEWGRSPGILKEGSFTVDPQEPSGWEMDLFLTDDPSDR